VVQAPPEPLSPAKFTSTSPHVELTGILCILSTWPPNESPPFGVQPSISLLSLPLHLGQCPEAQSRLLCAQNRWHYSTSKGFPFIAMDVSKPRIALVSEENALYTHTLYLFVKLCMHSHFIERLRLVLKSVRHIRSCFGTKHRKNSITIIRRSSTRSSLLARQSRIPRPTARQVRADRRASKGRIGKMWTGKQSTIGSRGLPNPGNYCYRNAVLQCWIHLCEFNQYCADNHTDCQLTPSECVPCSLKELIRSYWTDLHEFQLARHATALHETMESTVPWNHDMAEEIESKVQSDAFDFMNYLVDMLENGERMPTHRRSGSCSRSDTKRNGRATNAGVPTGAMQDMTR